MELSREELNYEFKIRLQDEFSRRCRVNSRYSIRAFANHLQIDSSTLSQILSGKRKVSKTVIDRIYKQLGFRSRKQLTNESFSLVTMDAFAVISDWYHYAILDLVLLDSFKSDVKWIAHKLQISSVEAKQAVERLLRLGLLVRENGDLKKADGFYTNYSEGVTSAAHKEYQRQVLTKALQAIDECAQERKDITSMTIAANSSRLPQAKEKIKKFRRELCAYLEDGKKDAVYHLAVQLYPVTTIDN